MESKVIGRGRCPSHHLIPTHSNLGASGTADHVTLLRLFIVVVDVIYDLNLQDPFLNPTPGPGSVGAIRLQGDADFRFQL